MSSPNALGIAFAEVCRRESDRLILLEAASGLRLSRRDLWARIEDRATALRTLGAASSSPLLAVRLPNGADFVATIAACWVTGVVPVPIDADLAEPEARLAIARLGVGHRIDEERGLHETGAFPNDDVPPSTAVVKLTSGSTGEPRGVCVSVEALSAGIDQIASTMGIDGDDRNLVTIPLAHSYAFDNVVGLMARLGTAAVIARDQVPRQLVRLATAEGVTVWPAVPFLLDLLARSSVSPMEGLRLVISAGAPLPVATRDAFAARFGVRPRNFYGSTECGGICFDRGDTSLPDGCVGSTLDGVRLTLEDRDGDSGRVRVHGASVATGYLPSEPRGGGDLGSGSFLTGDLGRVDEGGRLHLMGRAIDVVNIGGRKVFPAEVERVIAGIDGVDEVVVVGVRRSSVAEALRAVVVARPGVDRAAVQEACEGALSRYKVPRKIDFLDRLPRTGRGKVDRRALAAALTENDEVR